MRYNWSVPELRIHIPLHPLIAEARRHTADVQVIGYASNVSPTTRWASILGVADISRLICAEDDRVVLKAYMEYLQGYQAHI